VEIVEIMISLHPIIREDKEAGGDFPELAVKHLRREQNGVARKLAQLAKANCSCCGVVWSFLSV
jgi:hypothetical protein